MKNTHKDVSRKTWTRATAIAVSAGLIFTTNQIATAQNSASDASAPSSEVSAPATTSAEPTPVASAVVPTTEVTSTSVTAAPELKLPGDYLVDSLSVLGVKEDAKPESSTGLVDWSAPELSKDNGFISSPNALAPRTVELKVTAAKGLEGFFNKFALAGEHFISLRAALPTTQTVGLTGTKELAHTDFSLVDVENSTSKAIKDTMKVEVGEDGRELKISYTTPTGVGAFVGFETPGYFTKFEKDAKFDITAELTSDVPGHVVLSPSETVSVSAKADKDYKAPKDAEVKASVEYFVNDVNPKAPTGKTPEGTSSKVSGEKATVVAKGAETNVSVKIKNESKEVNLVAPTVAYPDGTAETLDLDLKPGEEYVAVTKISQGDVEKESIVGADLTGIETNPAGSELTVETKTLGDLAQPYALDASIVAGGSATLPVKSATNVSLEGATLSLADNAPEWVKIDGMNLVASPGEDVKADVYKFDVKAVLSDKSEKTFPMEITVTTPATEAAESEDPETDAKKSLIGYDQFSVEQNTTATMVLQGSYPRGTVFKFTEFTPSWMTLDRNTGNIVFTPDEEISTGNHPIKPIEAKFPDGSTKLLEDYSVNVKKAAPQPTTSKTTTSAAPTSTKSQAQEINDQVKEVGSVIAGVVGVLGPILGIAGTSVNAGKTTTTRPSTTRSTSSRTTGSRTTGTATTRSNTSGNTNRSAGTVRTTRTTTRRATSNSTRSTRSTRATRVTRATTSSRRSSSSRLANTGANTWTITFIGLLLMALAGIFLVISRRQREN